MSLHFSLEEARNSSEEEVPRKERKREPKRKIQSQETEETVQTPFEAMEEAREASKKKEKEKVRRDGKHVSSSPRRRAVGVKRKLF